MIADRRVGLEGALGVLAALAALALATPARAGNPGSGKISEELTATAAAPGARGRAVVIVRDSELRLRVAARGLQRRTTHDVILDHVKIGTLTTSGRGNGRARFRSRPHDQLLGTDPRGKTIILRRADAADVLIANIPGPRDPTPGDPSDDLIRCCLPDDRGTECEDRTADECAARRGVDMGPGSCLPNPCGSSARAAGSICCVPEDGGTRCEDRTEADCVAEGGAVVSASSCTPDPCASLPPAEPEIQCCLRDDDGFECEDRTAETCAAQGGIDMGPGTCSPNPCPTGGAPGGGVRCCVPESDGGTECEVRTADECAARGGTDVGPETCEPDSCGGSARH